MERVRLTEAELLDELNSKLAETEERPAGCFRTVDLQEHLGVCDMAARERIRRMIKEGLVRPTRFEITAMDGRRMRVAGYQKVEG